MSIRAPSIRPLYDHVVVRRLESSTTSAGGIVIPDSASEKPNRGEVLAVGPGKLLDNGSLRELSVKPGDQVLFGKYSANEIRIDGEDVLILKESDILGILESTLDNTLANTREKNAKLEKAA